MLRACVRRKAVRAWHPTPLALRAITPDTSSTVTTAAPGVVTRREADAAAHTTILQTPPQDFRPSPSEAPELLQPYVEPTPFISRSRLQRFTASMAVGAASVGLVYYLLQSHVGQHVTQETAQLERLGQRRRVWAQAQQPPELPSFVAPSTYEELRRTLEQSRLETAQREAEAARGGRAASTFHAELIHRLKLWWNRSLDNVQDAIAQEERKERGVTGRIESALRLHGYTLLRLTAQRGVGTDTAAESELDAAPVAAVQHDVDAAETPVEAGVAQVASEGSN